MLFQKRILTHFTGEGAVQVHSIGKVVHHLNFVVALQDLLEAYSLAGNLSALLPHSHTEMILRETYFTYHSPRHFHNFFSNHGGEIANSKKSLCETCHSIQINTLCVELAKPLTKHQKNNQKINSLISNIHQLSWMLSTKILTEATNHFHPKSVCLL